MTPSNHLVESPCYPGGEFKVRSFLPGTTAVESGRFCSHCQNARGTNWAPTQERRAGDVLEAPDLLGREASLGLRSR